eukprot:CAMPEP_0113593984 /NCGR_PEP_ID=MMETSP0015_2-20120614/38799_1 /TAXON_ID=2838 /ORGANISM="Odontella" /LENGTH=53 /DNA_ID=CAMNT_0000500879 /DNA_START=1 /DNA_END=159 /DNA_ORIENTATION=+ /assembly_acc=CAM_ASM_000160
MNVVGQAEEIRSDLRGQGQSLRGVQGKEDPAMEHLLRERNAIENSHRAAMNVV